MGCKRAGLWTTVLPWRSLGIAEFEQHVGGLVRRFVSDKHT